jgi:hypothetical protein
MLKGFTHRDVYKLQVSRDPREAQLGGFTHANLLSRAVTFLKPAIYLVLLGLGRVARHLLPA